MKRFAVLGLLLVAALVVPASALAEPFTPEMESDYQSALSWWGTASPPQCATVRREVAPSDPYGEGAIARSTQPEPGTADMECVITIYADGWATETPCMRAVTLRHEVGHTLGFGHSQDPTSIMHAPPEVSVWCPDYAQEVSNEIGKQLLPQQWAEWRKERAKCRRRLRHNPKSICPRFVKAQFTALRELEAS